ncbi:Hpt domain-containing protein [Salinivibrio socompensis]|uniref:Hpt domain-containing protein n=1 Tax=Salinivibrio socompensis TaxID=1510206 RepID=UPI00046EA6E8|nr:Hpt domain-containing protein [Salinivibrio socompensis]
MDDYITKPIELDQLESRLNHWLSKSPNTISNTAQEQEPKTSATRESSLTILDLNVIERLYAGQKQSYLDIIAIFRQRSLPSLSTLSQLAPPFTDWEGIKEAAHKQKSATGSIGAIELHQACLDAEHAAKAQDTQALDEALTQMQAAITRLTYTLDTLDIESARIKNNEFNDEFLIPKNILKISVQTSRSGATLKASIINHDGSE